LLFINIFMAHRKHIQALVEFAGDLWAKSARFELIDVDSTSYTWHVTNQNTVYEIYYSDSGVISLSALPSKCWPGSRSREIYSGDNSESSYQYMIGLLADNFVDQV
jgi:hypothetical protein